MKVTIKWSRKMRRRRENGGRVLPFFYHSFNKSYKKYPVIRKIVLFLIFLKTQDFVE